MLRLSPRTFHRAAARSGLAVLALSLLIAADEAPVDTAIRKEEPAVEPPRADWSGYRATGPRTVFDVQPYTQKVVVDVSDAGGPYTRATLVDLQPVVGAWHLLELVGPTASTALHLEVTDWRPRLDPTYPGGLVLEDADGTTLRCDLFTKDAAAALQAALASRRAYVPLCEGKVHVRVQLEGRKTTVEWASDLLRDNVWGGEQLTVFVRDTFFRDRHLERAELGVDAEVQKTRGGPPAARLTEAAAKGTLVAETLGLPVPEGPIVAGRWMPVTEQPGIYVLVTQPQLAHADVFTELGDRIKPLAPEEKDALVYLVAFDLDAFDVGYELGTDHPRLEWSDRIPEATKVVEMPGPDGFDTAIPLQRTGQVPPWRRGALAATFTGGFKRTHGAMQIGVMSRTHFGHHYGFVEHGVVFSKLQPGLSTLIVDQTGRVDLRTWSSSDEATMFTIRHARQNGVPILHPDPTTGEIVAGDLVRSWSGGNWASSVDGNLRSMRGGFCTIDSEGKRWLVYGYFTGATPSGMAAVFKAQGCTYAMLADMNALEHTYMAVYQREGDAWKVHHLDTGMAVLDDVGKGGEAQPRFVAFPDNRDFFHLVRK